MKSGIKEKDVLKAVKEFLDWKGIFYFRVNNMGVYKNGSYYFQGTPGVPDLILLHKGTMIGLELKSPGKGLSVTQTAFHERLVENGGISLVCSSLDELGADLEQIGVV